MLVRAVGLVSLLGAIAVFGGCGGRSDGGEATVYVAAVNTAQTRFSTAVERIGEGARATGSPARTVGRLSDAVDRVVSELEAVHAPARVDPQHARLIAELKRFDRALDEARRGFASRDRKAILSQRRRLIASSERATRNIDATIADINRSLGS